MPELPGGHDRGAAAGLTALSARGGELDRAFAWGVVRQLFDRALAGSSPEQRAALFADSAALARPAFGLGVGAAVSAETSFSTLHGLYWLTVNLAQGAPVLLAIDDLHWADRPSLRYVLHLASRISELPILLVLATRPVGSEPAAEAELLARLAAEPACQSLPLAPLSEPACAELVRDRLTSQAEDEFCLACYEMTRGNPFLIGALIDSLVAEGAPPTAEGAAHVRRLTPSSVSRTVLVRLATLPPGALSLARALAVLGTRAEFRLVRRLARLGSEDAAEVAGALVRAKIIRDGAAMEFVHPLVRAVIYADLPAAERNRWHQRATELLTGTALRPSGPRLICSPLPRRESADRGAAPPGRGSGTGQGRPRGRRRLPATCAGRAATRGYPGRGPVRDRPDRDHAGPRRGGVRSGASARRQRRGAAPGDDRLGAGRGADPGRAARGGDRRV
jgi:hypothetical protein